MITGMASTKLSISLPSELLERAHKTLAQPGEGRSALIARVLAQALREADEAEIDAAYERAYREHPIAQQDLQRSDALARAAVSSTRRARRKRGTAV